ncbi:ATP-binding protein [Streptomyces sp. NPDC001393]
MSTSRSQASAGNLPAQSTPFIGRRQEVTDIRGLLSSSRVLTLTGPGGVGKTRLAMHVAAEVRRAFRDGIWLVELAPLDDPALVAHSIVDALAISERSVRQPIEFLSKYLADKTLLLILDNCEHLLDACAVVADALMRAGPDIRILTTSRQPLGLPGEQIFVVRPLAVPDPNAATSIAELLTYDAVNLFVTRAASVLPGFTLTERNAEAVGALCSRLDGLPLAIELSAVRLRALSPEQVLERLDKRFRLLTGGSRAALPRQQTLHDLVDWSFRLCSRAEQTFWMRASVFAGSFDLDAAEEVCSDDELPRTAVLDVVAGLVDKSVLLREEHENSVRYRLLESIRQFGQDQLAEESDVLAWRRRHRDHYLRLMEETGADLFSPEGPSRLERIRLEHANLRAALGFSSAQPGEAAVGMRAAALLWFTWWREPSLLSEGRRWLDLLLAADTAPTVARAHALWANGALAVLQQDNDAARAMLTESTSLAQKLGDSSARAYAELFTGHVAMAEADFATAVRLLGHATEELRAIGDPFGTVVALYRLALAASGLGDGEQASRSAAECIDLCSRHGAAWLVPYGRWVQALEHWRRGEVAQAVTQARETARAHWASGDRIGTAQAIEVLAWCATAQGDTKRAAQLFGTLDAVWRTVGAPLFGFPHARYHDECVAECRNALGTKAFATAVERGARLSFDDVVAYALDQRPEAEPPASGHDPTPLTRREHQVADLVAQGMSNKEIAMTLVISRRTAEAHVEHILTKLGFTSRAQIVVWATARRKEAAPRERPDQL